MRGRKWPQPDSISHAIDQKRPSRALFHDRGNIQPALNCADIKKCLYLYFMLEHQPLRGDTMTVAANPLTDLLAEKGILLADGATGTNLFAMGLEAGEAPELWNEQHPDRITKLHQDFVDAGAD